MRVIAIEEWHNSTATTTYRLTRLNSCSIEQTILPLLPKDPSETAGCLSGTDQGVNRDLSPPEFPSRGGDGMFRFCLRAQPLETIRG